MTDTIANLTLTAVIEEIDDFLEIYPNQIHQQIFSLPDLRYKLIAYVMSRIKGNYVVVDNQNTDFSPQKIYCTEERLQIEALIREGIKRLTQEQADGFDPHISQTIHPAIAPSSWFG